MMEWFLAKEDHLVATLTLAGSIFEGINIICGMRVAVGMMELFKVDKTG